MSEMSFILSSTLFILRIIRYLDNHTNNSNLQYTLLTRVLMNYNAVRYITDAIHYITSPKYIDYTPQEAPPLDFDDENTEIIEMDEGPIN